MELTKQDKKHIKDEVSKLVFRINIESQEYAKLYEKTYLEELIERLKERIETIEYVNKLTILASTPKQQP